MATMATVEVEVGAMGAATETTEAATEAIEAVLESAVESGSTLDLVAARKLFILVRNHQLIFLYSWIFEDK